MPSLDPGDIYRDLVLAFEMQRGRPVGQALEDLRLAALDIAAARRAAQAAAPPVARALPIIAGGAAGVVALEASALAAAGTAAAPAALALFGAYAGASIVSGAFETFRVLGQARTAEAQAKQLDFELRTLAPRLQASRLAAEGAAQRAADAERRYQDTQASIESRELARREALAARDAELAETRAIERYEGQQFAIAQQQRRFEEQRQLQEERSREQREAEERREEFQRERDASIAAGRAEQQERDFAFRAAVEQNRAQERAASLAVQLARLAFEERKNAAIEQARADALARQQSTTLPLGSSPIGDLPVSDRPGSYRPAPCVTWQTAVANGLVAQIAWDPQLGTRALSPQGSIYNTTMTQCPWGYIPDPRRRILLGQKVPEIL